ncbi:MAG: LytR C-terminal domain-containing protein [Gemmatimonadaceae bacterium]
MTGRLRQASLAALAVALGSAIYVVTRPPAGADAASVHGRATAGAPEADSSRAPAGVRVRVEVLNASRVRGLARRATMELRDRGFDVVAMGNSGDLRDSTLVLSRAGDEEWARRVALALGGATVQLRPDSSRYVEVSVLLGATWRPPPGPFRP